MISMKQQFSELQAPLKSVIEKLLLQIRKNGQLEQHQRKIEEIKIYDRLMKKYINKEKLKKELGEDYESSGSDSEAETDYKGLNSNQLRYLMRKNLIRKNFNPSVLNEVRLYSEDEEVAPDDPNDSQTEVNDFEVFAQQGLNTIKEANEIFVEDLKEENNLFALKFIIDQLTKIEIMRKLKSEKESVELVRKSDSECEEKKKERKRLAFAE